MLTFVAIAVGALALWVLLGALRPLVEKGVVTSADWERVEDESLTLLDQRERLVAELRELEFEAALDKIGRKDLDELRTRYEIEAVALDRRLEEQAGRYTAQIAADVEARLAGKGDPPPPPEEAAAVEAPAAAPTEATCPQCRVANRPGARFCNECGAALHAAAAKVVLVKSLIFLAFLVPFPALAQYDPPAAPPSMGGGLPPFLAKMKRHDLTVRVERRLADGRTEPAPAGLVAGIRILAGGARVKDYNANTDAQGVALFQGVPSNPEVQSSITYEAYVIADDVRFPFELGGVPTDQAEIKVTVPEVTTELSDVTLEHAFIELFPDEETLVARHEMRLSYQGAKAVNLGALPGGGLVIPCPKGAKHPSLHDEHDPLVEVRGTDIIFKGALLPGGAPAAFTVVYQIPYDSETFEWSQPVPVPASLGVVVVSLDRQPGHRQAFPLNLQARDGLGSAEKSELDGGRKFALIRGDAKTLAAGQPLRFAVTGLPEPPNWKAWSLLAAMVGVVAVVLLGFRSRGPVEGTRLSRAHLVTERDRLVRALARMRRARDKGRLSEVRFEREREAITARLVSLYRALDRTESR